MSGNDHSAEDVAGLFRKFGGDSHAYKEFAPPEPTGEDGRTGWPLLSSGGITRAPEPAGRPAPPAMPVAQVPPPAPAWPVSQDPAVLDAAPFAPAAPLAAPFAPVSPPPARLADARGPDGPTELEALFARLAAPRRPEPAPGPMSRWRRPT